MQFVTLVIAVLGLLTATVSLGWQITQHRLNGAVVVCELLWGGLRGDAVAVGPLSGTLRTLVDQGFTDLVVAVRGRNKGRLAADITSFEVVTPTGLAFAFPGWRVNPDLPHRLEPGSSATFVIPLHHIAALVDASGEIDRPTDRIRARLTLGSGQTAVSEYSTFPAGRP